MSIDRYVLHAGTGRPWWTDPTLPQYIVDSDDDWKALKDRAAKRQEEFDWWNMYDADTGYGLQCGWSTGRTSPRVMERPDVAAA